MSGNIREGGWEMPGNPVKYRVVANLKGRK